MIMESLYNEDYLRYDYDEDTREDLITVVMQNVT